MGRIKDSGNPPSHSSMSRVKSTQIVKRVEPSPPPDVRVRSNNFVYILTIIAVLLLATILLIRISPDKPRGVPVSTLVPTQPIPEIVNPVVIDPIVEVIEDIPVELPKTPPADLVENAPELKTIAPVPVVTISRKPRTVRNRPTDSKERTTDTSGHTEPVQPAPNGAVDAEPMRLIPEQTTTVPLLD